MRDTKILIFFIILLTTVELKAQTNFIKGYYVTNSADTIHGYIEYRSANRFHKFFVFKNEHNSKPVTIKPLSVSGFVINDTERYEAHTFKNKRGNELLNGFFKVLVSGKLSLLIYQSRYFAKNQDGEIFEISKGVKADGNKLKEDFYGLGMLKFLMKDCEDLTGNLASKYKSGNFISIFKQYNHCVGSPIIEPQKKLDINPHVDFGLNFSPTISTISFIGSLEKVNFENNLSLSAGGFASIFIPRVNEKMRLVLEASYIRNKYYSYFTEGNTNNDLYADLSCLRIPVLLRYSSGLFFFDIGIQNQVILDQEFRWRVETVQQTSVNTSDGSVPLLNTWCLGYLAGFGLQYHVAGYPVRSSLRFSQNKMSSHLNEPIFRAIELNLSIQLTK